MKFFPVRMWMCVVSILVSMVIAFGLYLASDTYIWEGEATVTGVTKNSDFILLQMEAPGHKFQTHDLDLEAQYLNDIVTKQNRIRTLHCRVTDTGWGLCLPVMK